ncbi:MAG: DciA family protein [Candidatus Ratteibacteria bacterium]
MEIERIDSVLKRVLSKVETTTEKDRNIDITVLWPKIIDEKIRGKSYVLYEKNRKLYVKVEDGCFLSILRMNKGKILKKLQNLGFNYYDIIFLI